MVNEREMFSNLNLYPLQNVNHLNNPERQASFTPTDLHVSKHKEENVNYECTLRKQGKGKGLSTSA